MWARIESNNIVEYYDRKQSIVLNNVRYSSQIFTIWTDAQRKDLGIVPIVISGSHLDTNYYIEKNHSDAIAGDGNSVIRTIGVKAADRALADVNEVWTQSEIDGGQAPDGTFVYTGFKPAFVMVKYVGSGESWVILDNKRDGYNATNKNLRANNEYAESSGSTYDIDFLSNGFKPRTTWEGLNGSGYTIIYLAMAKNPFKYATAR